MPEGQNQPPLAPLSPSQPNCTGTKIRLPSRCTNSATDLPDLPIASRTWFNQAVDGATPAEREAARTRVLEYNEDDVRATSVLREWLTGMDAAG